MSPETLWTDLRQCFESDDGSLPTIELRNLGAADVVRLYGLVRQRARVVSAGATFWDIETANDRALDDVPNAALRVVTGRAAPFHFVVGGAVARRVTIPDLGVHVFQDAIALDYRMGPAWHEDEVFAFFSWLDELLEGTQGTVVASASEGPPDPEAFVLAWNRFRLASPTERGR